MSDQSGFTELVSVGLSTIPGLYATADKLLHDNHHSTVYAATLVHDKTRVVLKLSLDLQSFKDLKREVNHYNGGNIVPKFYGMYEGSCTAHSRRKIACLVLEYCGTRVTGEFRDLPLDEQLKILNVLSALHSHGMHHTDFAERNVVQKNGKYYLIDFASLMMHDGCHFDNYWRAGEPVEEIDTMQCGILEGRAMSTSVAADDAQGMDGKQRRRMTPLELAWDLANAGGWMRINQQRRMTPRNRFNATG
ncbi:hypothetical protein B0H34DRAFT_802324 [Crassisporium funariophilum]|nr:hypothetical protein B0H34DRAFT_802324 [Crassisporium funariophilum]